ncbi:SapC family protein [Sphingomonas sp. S2-65]|uniref:SapC family protein n=1 Tax=Sphingomonas sp. S2-65 TaxID=2903960 RepID=UPI001F3192DA|nr:SapC family protein [Sphingomonas sp. S2-65]UYY59247.1 SapC family protein [Sphingomonas sp. S2-65]
MPNRVVLNNVDHRDLTVAIRYGAEFGDAVNQVQVFPAEFEAAQREFPIVFQRGPAGLDAVALLGLDRDENLFLNGDRWTSRHIPLLQQRGPFSIGTDATGGGTPMLHIDLDDPRTGAPDGAAIFLQHGGNGPYLNHVTHLLRLIHAGVEGARTMYAAFDALGLIEPVALEVMLNEDTRYAITGYEVLARERLNALTGTQLETLQKADFLAPAFLIPTSLGNIGELIRRKNARRGAI